MKKLNRLRTLALAALAAAAFANVAVAQPTNFVFPFDATGSDASWIRWWGVEFEKPAWDSTMDASNSVDSGSLKAVIPYAGASGEQFCFFGNFKNVQSWDASVTLDGTKYTNVVFDIRVDPSSGLTSGGHFGGLEVGLATASWGQAWLNGWPLPQAAYNIPATATSEWVRVTIAIDPTTSGLDNVAGVIFKMWSNGAHPSPLTFWIDNITLVAKEGPPPPPPTMGIEKPRSGLNLFGSQGGAAHQRQGIRTTLPSYSWLTYPFDPVTYSMTIKAFPATNFGGYQAHMFLAPQSAMPNGPGDAAIDWNTTNIIFIQITQNEDGSGNGRFMYKTNQPSGNAMLWNEYETNGPVGTVAFLWAPTVAGTWSVTLDAGPDTVTMTGPGGVSTNFAMPQPLAEDPENNLFSGAFDVYFGSQPNGVGNIGQSVVLSRAQIQCNDPAMPALDDDFSGETLDTTKWTVTASDAAGIFIVPANAAYWLNWTLPDTGFKLQNSSTLTPAVWTDLLPARVFRNNNGQKALIGDWQLPVTPENYFQLAK